MLSRFCNRLLVNVFIYLIRAYQILLSPLTLSSCRYLPTCSQYAVEAFEKHGLIRGIWLTCRRLLSCHFWAKPKVDEVP